MKVRRAVVVVLVAGIVSGCGGSDGGGQIRGVPRTESDAAAVIRRWADTLRRGDVRGAADLFALPSIVSNGTPPVTLRTRADARRFNESLPCGARLLKTSSAGRFTTATFRLTERPGPGTCGGGVGLTARTTFVIEGGKIREWRRVADQPTTPGRTA